MERGLRAKRERREERRMGRMVGWIWLVGGGWWIEVDKSKGGWWWCVV